MVVRLLIDIALLRFRSASARDIEFVSLRHEVRVLRRRVKRTTWRPGDRAVLAALSRCVPRTLWVVFPVRTRDALAVAPGPGQPQVGRLRRAPTPGPAAAP